MLLLHRSCSVHRHKRERMRPKNKWQDSKNISCTSLDFSFVSSSSSTSSVFYLWHASAVASETVNHSAVKKLKSSERWLEHWEWLNQQFGGFWGKKHTLVSSATQQGLDVHERQQCWIMAESFPWWRKTPSQPSEEHSSVSEHISSPGPINTFPLPLMLFHHHICFSNLFDSGRPGFSFSTTAGLPAGRWVPILTALMKNHCERSGSAHPVTNIYCNFFTLFSHLKLLNLKHYRKLIFHQQ